MPVLYITDERNTGPDAVATYVALTNLFNDQAESAQILCADFENYFEHFINTNAQSIPNVVYIDCAEAHASEIERTINEFAEKLRNRSVESVFAVNCPTDLKTYAEKLGIFVIHGSEEKSQALSLIETLAR
ncbi:MAG: hypothetical protein KDJ75_02670 [Alphaproteobacteria bacterium]|nr:hypothetical protein [Alphaproteobacteria bacterium]